MYSSNKFLKIAPLENFTLEKIKINNSNVKYLYSIAKDNELTFGIYAPFWYPKFIKKNLNDNQLYAIIENLINFKYKNKFKCIRLKLPPNFYNVNLLTFKDQIMKSGFKKKNNYLHSYISLNDYENVDKYINSLSPSSKNNINYYKKKIKFFKIDNSNYDDLKSCYNLIQLNRNRKNLKLKYNYQYLKKLSENFTEKLKIFYLTDEKEKLASAICHHTQENIVYISNWGDFHNYKRNINYYFYYCIFKYFKDLNFDYIDFGFTTSPSQENKGLYNFKSNLRNKFTLNNEFIFE
jgi:hypothetical protein